MPKPSLGLVAAMDFLAVLVFCGVGRRSHDEAFELAGFARTAWPFAAATGIGWVIAWLFSRRAGQLFSPHRVVSEGVIIWLCAAPLGLVLRFVSGQSVALSFLIVATTTLGIMFLGWRGVYAALNRRSSAR